MRRPGVVRSSPVELVASTTGPPGGVEDGRDRARRDDDALEQVEVRAEGVGDRRLDRIGVRDGDDRLTAVARRRARRAVVDHAGLHLGERLAAGKAEPARVALHGAPLGQLAQILQFAPGPVAEVALEQPAVDPHPRARAPWRWARRSRGCARAARRRRRRRSSAATMRVAAASACSRPPSARCKPRPGRAGWCRSSGSGRAGRAARASAQAPWISSWNGA